VITSGPLETISNLYLVAEKSEILAVPGSAGILPAMAERPVPDVAGRMPALPGSAFQESEAISLVKATRH
jgi:hypothetical protein